MSTLFGVRGPAGRVVKEGLLRRLSYASRRYASDGTYLVAEGEIGMGFQPFYTHERSRREVAPVSDISGNMLSLDGRIDNYEDLATDLDLPPDETPDSRLILAAFRRWKEDAFSQLTGEWALALWSRVDRSLYLARDHAGTRTLYYEQRDGSLFWSSNLENLVSTSTNLEISKEFAIRFFASIPAGTLTPFARIRAVPPGHFLKSEAESAEVHRHWDAVGVDAPDVRSDWELEEEFYALFERAVERRTEGGTPVLAQLSGGMDSSAIVCMSDALRKARGKSSAELIDTISFFDSSEPNWDEKPYFSLIESRRGKSGIHVDLSSDAQNRVWEAFEPASPTVWPEEIFGASHQPEAAHGFRVVLSGLGGDELLGGVPTSLPELGDLLHHRRYLRFLARSFAWCQADRTALVDRIRETLAYCWSSYAGEMIRTEELPPWLLPDSVRAIDLGADAHLHYRRSKLVTPSKVSLQRAWWSLVDTLPKHRSGDWQRTEYRFPFLDKDLVDFLWWVPREQLVRPGRRRSLMRRALKDIIPAEILERRRKAFTIRRPVVVLRENHSTITSLFRNPLSAQMGLIDRSAFLRSLDEVVESSRIEWHRCLTRTALFEKWLQNLDTFRAHPEDGDFALEDPGVARSIGHAEINPTRRT